MAACRPEPGGVTEAAVQPQPFAVFFEPGAERGPFADEGFVGDFGGSFSQRDEACVGELAEHRVDCGCGAALGDELVDLDSAPGVFDAAADLGEPEEHAPEQRVELVGRCLDDSIGSAGDRRRHASGFAVAVDGECATVAELPCRPERVRQQRQRARLARNIAQDHVDQARLEPQPRDPGRLGDGAAQFAGVHGAEEDLVAGDGPGELRVGAQSTVEVGANADDDRPRMREERVDERPRASLRRCRG